MKEKCANLFNEGKDLNKSINLEPVAVIEEVEPAQKIMIGEQPKDSKVLIQDAVIEDDKDKSMTQSYP